ncbi:cold shock domain-containing protein [Paraburkholderia fungorum]|uniref:cold shock domain-containing protein n=1 Tax=Paraburkholderia fungorum TaxID=134537 RepID=UPI0038BACBE9
MNQSEELHYGTVKAYYPIKGFGFITRGAKKDVFFFFDDVKDEADILEGVKVKFQIVDTGKGPRAMKVERVG